LLLLLLLLLHCELHRFAAAVWLHEQLQYTYRETSMAEQPNSTSGQT
jgi:hypothetical protein